MFFTMFKTMKHIQYTPSSFCILLCDNLLIHCNLKAGPISTETARQSKKTCQGMPLKPQQCSVESSAHILGIPAPKETDTHNAS